MNMILPIPGLLKSQNRLGVPCGSSLQRTLFSTDGLYVMCVAGSGRAFTAYIFTKPAAAAQRCLNPAAGPPESLAVESAIHLKRDTADAADNTPGRVKVEGMLGRVPCRGQLA